MENEAAHDLREVVCGLVGQINDLARQAHPDEVRVMVRKGMETEILNAFGSGRELSVRIIEGDAHDTVILTPSTPEPDSLDII